ncbi:MAG: hypothetical protein V2A63_03325 [Patescibacteria group bacterium]
MLKFLKIACALVLVIPCVNLAYAADDMLGLDLPSGLDPLALSDTTEPLPTPQFANSDLLLGLDLPSDLGDLNTPTAPTIAESVTPPVGTPAISTAPTIPTTAGSGGAIGDEPVATHPAAPATPTTSTTTQTFYTPTPSTLFNTQIASASLLDSQYDYSLHATTTAKSKAKLAETGPAATLAFAIFGAIGLAFLLRKKLLNV